MILVIDNYDSFAYNLVQFVAEAEIRAAERRGEEPTEPVVRRNDEIGVEEIRALDPDGIVVSPGPGTPADAGVSIPVFSETEYPALGVCLGHQALCSAHGAPVVHAPEVVHGKPSTVRHDGDALFEGLPEAFEVGRYHSLAVEREDLPESLVETARTDGEQAILMAVRHHDRPHFGVQFHPESILTGPVARESAGEELSLELGKRLIANFCAFARSYDRDEETAAGNGGGER
ncbi:anthranilate synthase component 2 [Natronoarchaeum philippinense]|uniref:anthranilate synthase n=1 Tax=Natronoarchaeum philippinense TaxID=558529 RepID=A0A285P7C6_NATPI|nr:aminodeoxychorismate/anthranilate synthase component II [Natronoarchaeum philippinense]SNZ17348.1 anthranilate synthase component 2 [Natronoarchaeum philippinense]